MMNDCREGRLNETFGWEDVFQLPTVAYAGNRRIPKTVLVRQAMLTKTERRTLDKVGSLEHFATVQKSTTRILPVVNESYDVQSVVFLRCVLAGTQAFAEVAGLVHKCFQNPTVVLFESADSICVSAALPRKSCSEHGAVVVEKVEGTGGFRPDDGRYADFLNGLSFDRLPQNDLLQYVEAIIANVRLSKAIDVLGYFPVCEASDRGRLFDLITRYESVSHAVRAMADRRRTDRSLTLNESAKLRMEQKKLEKKAVGLAEQIKEICNGRH